MEGILWVHFGQRLRLLVIGIVGTIISLQDSETRDSSRAGADQWGERQSQVLTRRSGRDIDEDARHVHRLGLAYSPGSLQLELWD